MRDPWTWSATEKAVARKAFDRALNRECDELVRETQRRAASLRETSEVWELGKWIAERRKEIADRYDYRYSMLPFVFTGLLRENLIDKDDLKGLAQEKMDMILGMGAFAKSRE